MCKRPRTPGDQARPERSALPGFGVGEPVVPPRAPSWIVLAHRGAQIRTGDLSDPNGARYPASAWGNPWVPHGPPPRATRGSPTGPLLDRAGASGCPDSNWGPLRPERSALPGFGVGEPVVPPRAPSADDAA